MDGFTAVTSDINNETAARNLSSPPPPPPPSLAVLNNIAVLGLMHQLRLCQVLLLTLSGLWQIYNEYQDQC